MPSSSPVHSDLNGWRIIVAFKLNSFIIATGILGQKLNFLPYYKSVISECPEALQLSWQNCLQYC